MDESARLLTVFSAEIDQRGGTPTIEVPERELELGDVDPDGTYRVAILEHPGPPTEPDRTDTDEPRGATDGPPVEEGERREVEIEDLGEQGDGIARIGPGYVVFVPGTGIGDRVTVEIRDARENFAFAEVIEDEPLSE